MVDLHKGFEGFERLNPARKDKDDKEIKLSEAKDAGVLSRSNISKAEDLYDKILVFTRSVLDRVKDGKESEITAGEIQGPVREFCAAFQSGMEPDDLIRMVLTRNDYQENYLYTHSVNVCLLSARIALEMNFAQTVLQELVTAALFHDAGMMKIPLALWNNDKKLNEHDLAEIRKHPLYGEEIFRGVKGISDVIPVVIGQHQEKMDGSGYPRGLSKDAIHYLARLLSLLNAYESQTHSRLFRGHLLPDEAIQRILDDEASGYDPHFVKALLKFVSIFPVGSWVSISTGEIGEVVKTNKDTPMRPVINIVYDRTKKRLSKSRFIDLSKQLLIHVDNCVEINDMR